MCPPFTNGLIAINDICNGLARMPVFPDSKGKPMTKSKCKCCGYEESAEKEFFLKLLGGSAVGFGFYAWIRYIFAGTGFALVICSAIIAGGAGMLAFSDEITKWISERFDCPECESNEWDLIK